MKPLVKDIRSGLTMAITFLSVIFLVGMVYAATISHVNPGDPVTAAKWNEMVDAVNNGGSGGSPNNVLIGVPVSLPSAGYVQIYANYLGANLIPTMTSNTAPSGTVSASTKYVGVSEWNAFNNAYNGWLTDGSTPLPGWIKYRFPNPETVTSYEITPWSVDNFPSRTPITWILQGSNDDSVWIDLDSRTNYTAWVVNTAKEFFFTNSTAYSYYRLYITANGGDGYTGIHQLKLNGIGTVPGLFLRDSAGSVKQFNLF